MRESEFCERKKMMEVRLSLPSTIPMNELLAQCHKDSGDIDI